jgi:hypothetical protein
MSDGGKLRIAFDVGGVLSKYPETFKRLLAGLVKTCEIHVISDMHDPAAIICMLDMNGFSDLVHYVHSADYASEGEECKAALCEQLGIDILIDDFIGYVACPGKPPVRLLVMPDPEKDYYAPEWRTSGEEGNFGRRKK